MYPAEITVAPLSDVQFEDTFEQLLDQMVGLARCLVETVMHRSDTPDDDCLVSALQVLANHAELMHNLYKERHSGETVQSEEDYA